MFDRALLSWFGRGSWVVVLLVVLCAGPMGACGRGEDVPATSERGSDPVATRVRMVQALLSEGHVAAALEQMERLRTVPGGTVSPERIPSWVEPVVAQLIRRRVLGPADSLLRRTGPVESRPPRLQAASANLAVLAGDEEGALRIYRSIRTEDPALRLRVAHELATLLLLRGQVDEAIETARAGLREEPDHGPLHVLLSQALARKGRVDEALAEVRLVPPSAARWVAEADLWLNSLDRPESAVVNLQKAVRVAPQQPRYRLLLGRALVEAGRPGDAAQVLEKLVEPTRAYPGAMEWLAKADRALGREKEAAALEARWAAEDRRRRAQEERLAGLRASAAGALESALAHFDAALAIDSTIADLYNDRGAVLARLERWTPAEEAFLEAARRAPGDRTIQENLARLYDRTGRIEERDRAIARWESLTASADSSGS